MTEGIALKTLDSKEHGTPDWIIKKLLQHSSRTAFDLDPAATPENAKAPVYYTQDQDGLSLPWNIRAPEKTLVFCNPPYGRDVGKWVRKAYEESFQDVISCLLLKVSSDTEWWHNYVMKADSIQFIRGRVKYQGVSSGPAPFPSCIVVFRPNRCRAPWVRYPLFGTLEEREVW